jgi:uncharacterized membrane protein YraQ (UPF0718 family)
MKSRGVSFLITAFVLSACAPSVLESGTSIAAATPVPIYTCAYFSAYDTLSACQSASKANCNSNWQTFPTGGISLCYTPVAGFEVCQVTVPTWDWLYTLYSPWCDTGAVGPAVFRQDRSLIGCSSAICNCATIPVTSHTCTFGVDCPAASPTPSVACP